MPYASSNNAILIDGCNNLQDLSVLLEVTEDIATPTGTAGAFSSIAIRRRASTARPASLIYFST